MRIIAGEAKGRKILSPPDGNNTTRPTLDRVKESIFNIIQNYVYDSIVVDVFSGTGSLGLEAVSRGAKECYLFDKSPTTFAMLKENVVSLKFEDRCKCMNVDAYEGLNELGNKGIKFDLIFIDPPYCKEMIPKAIEIIDDLKMLKNDGVIVSKIDTKEHIFEGKGNIHIVDSRKYGNTTVCMYKTKED